MRIVINREPGQPLGWRIHGEGYGLRVLKTSGEGDWGVVEAGDIITKVNGIQYEKQVDDKLKQMLRDEVVLILEVQRSAIPSDVLTESALHTFLVAKVPDEFSTAVIPKGSRCWYRKLKPGHLVHHAMDGHPLQRGDYIVSLNEHIAKDRLKPGDTVEYLRPNKMNLKKITLRPDMFIWDKVSCSVVRAKREACPRIRHLLRAGDMLLQHIIGQDP